MPEGAFASSERPLLDEKSDDALELEGTIHR